ncbi:MAG: hypothetical protein U0271_44865 [Polyangiaceae bacterium]
MHHEAASEGADDARVDDGRAGRGRFELLGGALEGLRCQVRGRARPAAEFGAASPGGAIAGFPRRRRPLPWGWRA